MPDFEGNCAVKECHGRRDVSGTGTGAAGGCYELCSFPTPPLLEEEGISLCPPRDDLMSSEEEGSRDWRPQHGDHDSLPEVLPCDRESSVATSRPSAQESVGRDEALPFGDPDARRYKDTLQNVFSFNPNMVPQDVPVDNVFGGELMALCHETQKEDRHPSLSGRVRGARERLASHGGSVGRSGPLSSRGGGSCPRKCSAVGDIHVPDFTASIDQNITGSTTRRLSRRPRFYNRNSCTLPPPSWPSPRAPLRPISGSGTLC